MMVFLPIPSAVFVGDIVIDVMVISIQSEDLKASQFN
jgi:hypothetical protein